MIKHHANCSADYPEKPSDEVAQSTTDIDIGDGLIARCCNDCGAFEVVSKKLPSDAVTQGIRGAAQESDEVTSVVNKLSMRVIVAGSRGFNDYQKLDRAMNHLCRAYNDITVISGTARGADQLGEQWATEHGHPIIRMPAEWDKHGRSAGYKRNEAMATVATHCVCFWDGHSPGTGHMIDIAKRRGLPTRVITY